MFEIFVKTHTTSWAGRGRAGPDKQTLALDSDLVHVES